MWQKNVRYLDYNATSGITGSVRKKLIETLSRADFYFANPSSQHQWGQQSQQALVRAGMKIASSFGNGIDSKQLVFTSSGTEANQTVIRSAMKFADAIIIGAGEHSASYDQLSEIPANIRSAELPLLSNGQYNLEFLSELLNDVKQTGGCSKVFLSLFWANNETGVTTSLEKLDAILRSSGLSVFLHLDGAQVWGKMEIDLLKTPASYITFSSHKIGAPAGLGVIWIRPDMPFYPLVTGMQSRGLRGGTENILAISAVSFAVEELNPRAFISHTSALRTQLENELSKHRIKIWGQDSNRISNTCRFSILGFENYENWVELLDLRGFAVSHGSACKSKVIEPSRVLMKMGASRGEALNSIRLSFGPTTQSADIDDFLVAFQGILSEKRGRS